MSELRGWIIYSWIALPTVMYGGYSLLRLLTQANALTPFRLTWFRVGHAHAGVLLIDVAAVLHVHGQDVLVPSGQACGVRDACGGHPGSIGRFLSPYGQGAAKPRFHRHHRDHDWRHTTHLRHCHMVYGLFTAH